MSAPIMSSTTSTPSEIDAESGNDTVVRPEPQDLGANAISDGSAVGTQDTPEASEPPSAPVTSAPAESAESTASSESAEPDESPATGTNEAAAKTEETESAASAESTASSETVAPAESSAASEKNEAAASTEKAESTPAPRPRRTEFEKLQKAIPGTSYKDLPTLLALQRRLVALMTKPAATSSSDSVQNEPTAPTNTSEPGAAVDAPDTGAQQADLEKLAAKLEQLIQQHHDWQAKTVSELEAAVEKLAQQIAAGQVSESQSLWDRSQSALRRVNEEDRARLQEAFAPLRADLTKLLDWRKFASSEKKKELIEKMQALVEDDTAPVQKARLIRALQDEWKTLGHSEDNDALWTQFSEAGRLAFEPCKQYFRERKELQAANLVARNNICEQLEAYAASLNETPEPDLGEINRLEQQAREDWKKYAPVAQNKIKALQKRFNSALGELRRHKKAALQKHNSAKQALIDQAKALLEHSDLNEAIRQSKDLQQQWKALGPGSFRDDRKLWTEFRGACDELFARRAENRPARGASSANSAPAREAVRQVLDLLALDDEAFAESRPRFNQASKAFRDALSPELRAGERKALQDQFNKASKRYDMRMRLTPDRKQLQLQQQVQQHAMLCQELEEQLLNGKHPSLGAGEFEQQWAVLDKVDDKDIDQVLQKRFRQLNQWLSNDSAASHAEVSRTAERQATSAREICVDAEIMSGADTPSEDKAVRMQLQLNQLQKGLGRLPTSARDQMARLQQAELQLLSTGPLDPALRTSLTSRLEKIRQRFQ